METDFQSLGCCRCGEVVCYVEKEMPLNEKLRLSHFDLHCWQCTQLVRLTSKRVTEVPLPPTLIPPDGPRAA